ncbi:MAG TPA: hypothetical protein VL334_00630 [Anaerolineae bacterium]|nr:hypothetical protein [Anaerolineae bacterium]
MATTINNAFSEFASNLELTDRQANLVSTRRENVIKSFKQALTLHTEEAKVIGSWDRKTLTRYLYECDVDVMVILSYGIHKDWDTGPGTVAVLDRFRSVLSGAYPQTTMRRDRNCITMQFSEFRLDVVPAFKYNEGYYSIPDSIRQKWVLTNPFAFAAKVTEINKAMGGAFVPLIKMVKAWNRHVDWPIRSFHIECMMVQRYQHYTQGYTYSSMLKRFFESLPGYLAQPTIDPVMGDRVDTYLDNNATKTRRQVAKEKAQAAAAAAKEALEDEEKYPPVAINEWKALLGEFFPNYG